MPKILRIFIVCRKGCTKKPQKKLEFFSLLRRNAIFMTRFMKSEAFNFVLCAEKKEKINNKNNNKKATEKRKKTFHPASAPAVFPQPHKTHEFSLSVHLNS